MYDIMYASDPVAVIAMGASSANVALPGKGTYMIIGNPSADMVYIKMGKTNSVAATTADTPIPPKSSVPFRRKPEELYIAVIDPSAAGGNLSVQVGSGG